MRAKWQRLAAVVSTAKRQRCRCSAKLVVVVLADQAGTRATVFVCPHCDGTTAGAPVAQ